MKLTFYRQDANGNKVPYIFHMAPDRKTIIKEEIDHKLYERMKQDVLRAAGLERVQKDNTGEIIAPIPDQKVTVQRTRNGKTEYLQMENFDVDFARWMVIGTPNPFPGTDTMREQYFKDMEEFEESGKCAGCEGSPIHLYKQKIRALVAT